MNILAVTWGQRSEFNENIPTNTCNTNHNNPFSMLLWIAVLRYESQTMQWPNEKWKKGQKTIYKTLHKNIKIDQHELHQKPGEASEW